MSLRDAPLGEVLSAHFSFQPVLFVTWFLERGGRKALRVGRLLIYSCVRSGNGRHVRLSCWWRCFLFGFILCHGHLKLMYKVLGLQRAGASRRAVRVSWRHAWQAVALWAPVFTQNELLIIVRLCVCRVFCVIRVCCSLYVECCV